MRRPRTLAALAFALLATCLAAGVASLIKAAGGKAVANFDSVADHEAAEHLIKTALDFTAHQKEHAGRTFAAAD